MSNRNIVILDWSNLMYRSLFLNSLTFEKNVTYNDFDEVASFIGKFATDVASLLKTFNPGNVIIATDAQNPWRKKILEKEEVGYKSNRHKNNGWNWDNIYKASNDLLSIFKSKGFNIAHVENAEADDIIALCKEVAFESVKDANIIIVSADADIRQVIDFNEDTHQYCIVYNTIAKGKSKGSKRYVYATKSFIDWYNMPEINDIFFSNRDASKQYIQNIINSNSQMELVEDNPSNILLSKIFCGDDGDCVPALYEWYKDGKKARITNSKFVKVCNELEISTVKDLVEKELLLKPAIEKVIKQDLKIDVHERVNRQRALVELNSDFFPSNLKEYKDTIEFMLKKNVAIDIANFNSNKILENTEFGNALSKKKMSRIEKEVFNDISKYLGGSSTMQKLF